MEKILNLFIMTISSMWEAIGRCKIPFGSTYFSLADVLVVCFIFLSFGKFLSTLFGFASEYNDFTIRHEAWKTRKFKNMNSSKKSSYSNIRDNKFNKFSSRFEEDWNKKYNQIAEDEWKSISKNHKGGK